MNSRFNSPVLVAAKDELEYALKQVYSPADFSSTAEYYNFNEGCSKLVERYFYEEILKRDSKRPNMRYKNKVAAAVIIVQSEMFSVEFKNSINAKIRESLQLNPNSLVVYVKLITSLAPQYKSRVIQNTFENCYARLKNSLKKTVKNTKMKESLSRFATYNCSDGHELFSSSMDYFDDFMKKGMKCEGLCAALFMEKYNGQICAKDVAQACAISQPTLKHATKYLKELRESKDIVEDLDVEDVDENDESLSCESDVQIPFENVLESPPVDTLLEMPPCDEELLTESVLGKRCRSENESAVNEDVARYAPIPRQWTSESNVLRLPADLFRPELEQPAAFVEPDREGSSSTRSTLPYPENEISTERNNIVKEDSILADPGVNAGLVQMMSSLARGATGFDIDFPTHMLATCRDGKRNNSLSLAFSFHNSFPSFDDAILF